MLFDLKLKDGSTWMWGTNSSSIYRPDGTKLFVKKFPNPPPLEASKGNFHFSDMPVVADILLGEKCNKDCKYCYQAGLRKKGLNWKTGPDDVQPFVNLVREVFPIINGFCFWGGEPLVYWKTLKPLVEKLRPIYPASQMRVTTNGFLIDEEVVHWAVKNRVSLAVSWDGPGKLRGEDVYEANGKNLHYASEQLGYFFSIKPTAGKGCTNSEETRKFFQHRKFNSKVDTRGVIRIVPEHRGATTLTPKELKEIEESARWDALHGRVSLQETLVYLTQRRSPWSFPGECCVGTGQQIALNLKGDVYLCHYDFSGEPLGNLKDFDSLWVKGCYSPYERKVCRECPAVVACHGACPREPLDSEPTCAGRRARATGLLRAALEMLIGEEVLEIVPHGV